MAQRYNTYILEKTHWRPRHIQAHVIFHWKRLLTSYYIRMDSLFSILGWTNQMGQAQTTDWLHPEQHWCQETHMVLLWYPLQWLAIPKWAKTIQKSRNLLANPELNQYLINNPFNYFYSTNYFKNNFPNFDLNISF